ncbi:hypothetical protein JTE90_006929 [Oedothorax gibbosus]|uniref:Uncharacterized protein n=1 Tax=Oedothorax gibbosus TaxID=931172 RepID=A0AAV6VNN7_9ARAC|nr:hypothetical protein JTE90_006929 [Oedothorax gibbosus]
MSVEVRGEHEKGVFLIGPRGVIRTNTLSRGIVGIKHTNPMYRFLRVQKILKSNTNAFSRYLEDWMVVARSDGDLSSS